MASIAETLRAIEARAERAIVQELRQMAQDVLAMRPLLLPRERDHADALMLKLLHLASAQLVAPANAANAPAMLMPTLRYGEEQPARPRLTRSSSMTAITVTWKTWSPWRHSTPAFSWSATDWT